jgi:hypothetical protein
VIVLAQAYSAEPHILPFFLSRLNFEGKTETIDPNNDDIIRVLDDYINYPKTPGHQHPVTEVTSFFSKRSLLFDRISVLSVAPGMQATGVEYSLPLSYLLPTTAQKRECGGDHTITRRCKDA